MAGQLFDVHNRSEFSETMRSRMMGGEKKRPAARLSRQYRPSPVVDVSLFVFRGTISLSARQFCPGFISETVEMADEKSPPIVWQRRDRHARCPLICPPYLHGDKYWRVQEETGSNKRARSWQDAFNFRQFFSVAKNSLLIELRVYCGGKDKRWSGR